jgi:hypothetical protein
MFDIYIVFLWVWFGFGFLLVLVFELMAYTLSHSTIPFSVGFFLHRVS